MAVPPAFLMAAAVSSAGVGSISLTTTKAPSIPSFFAEAAPIPRPEPVTIAILPSIIPTVDLLLSTCDKEKSPHQHAIGKYAVSRSFTHFKIGTHLYVFTIYTILNIDANCIIYNSE